MLLIAEGAYDDNGLKGKFFYPGGHIPAASFAPNDESLSFLNSKAHHVSSRVYGGGATELVQF